jgi:DNA-directed RNA polymerase subunit omega
MNSELVKKALEVVVNPYVLVNMVSRRVRQLNAGGGGASAPMVGDTTNVGLADIALREIIEDKLSFEMPEIVQLTRPTGRNRRRPQSWGKMHSDSSAKAA